MKRYETGKLVLHRSLRISYGESDADKQAPAGMSMRTYVKVHGKWCYLYRAIDRDGNLVDSMLSQKRNMEAAKRFFRQTLETVGHAPERIITDGHDSYPRAIRETLGHDVLHQTNHYLNNLVEQDHRGIRTTLLSHARMRATSHRQHASVAPLMRFASSFAFVAPLDSLFPSRSNVI